jgi:predicted dehydrogenase
MTVRVGVIGTGVMGAEHARVLQGIVSGATVTAARGWGTNSVHECRRGNRCRQP